MERVAVVTGGSRGLGYALAGGLRSKGWLVVIDGRDGEALEAAVRQLGDGVTGVPGDVTDAGHRDQLLRTARALGPVGAVINNASALGPTPLAHLAQAQPDAVRAVFEVNVVAPLLMAQQFLSDLRAGGGALVNVTSDAAVEAYEGWGIYGLAKAALEQWSAVMAVEEPDVRVYTVDPGDMRTEMHQEAFPGEDISDRPEPDVSVPGLVALIEGRLPSGRYQARSVGDPAPVEVSR